MLFHLGENGYEECNVSVENKNDEIKILCLWKKLTYLLFSRPQTVYCVKNIYPLAL